MKFLKTFLFPLALVFSCGLLLRSACAEVGNGFGDRLGGLRTIVVESSGRLRVECFESIERHARYVPTNLGAAFRSKLSATSERIMPNIFQGYGDHWFLLLGLAPFLMVISIHRIFRSFHTAEKKEKQTEAPMKASEKRYRELVENAGSIILVLDPEGRITFINEFAERFLGFPKEEILGRHAVGTIVPPVESGGRDLDLLLDDIVHNPEVYANNENENIRRNGERVWISWTNRPVFDEHGRIREILCVGADATARKRVEEALRESVEKHRALFETMAQGVVYQDSEGRIIDANPAALEILGLIQDDIQGRTPFDSCRQVIREDGSFFASDEYPYVVALRTGAEARGVVMGVLDPRGGDCRWLNVHAVPLFAPGQSVPYRVYTFFDDVTERKRGEEALEKRLTALTRPLDADISVTFEELFDLKDIQRLLDEFSSATGVATLITHPDGSPITAESGFSRFCSDIVRRTEKGRHRCYDSDAQLGQISPSGPTIRRCMSGGFLGAGAGISLGGRHIANWLIGQVRDEKQTEEQIRVFAREIGTDENDAVEAFLEVPIMARDHFEKVARVMYTLSNQLSKAAYQNVMQARFIAERKKAEETLSEKHSQLQKTVLELEQARNMLQLVIESIPVRVFWKDRDSRYLGGNSLFARDAGLSDPEALVGMDDLDLAWAEHAELYRADDREVMESGVSKMNIVEPLTTSTGAGIWVNTGKVPLRLAGGEVFGVLGVYEDITERKQAEEERLKLEERLQRAEKMEALGTLAGGVAHDLNNVLGIVVGYAELLLTDLDGFGSEGPKAAEILKAGNRAAAIVQDLLTLARRGVHARKAVNMNDLLLESLNSIEFAKMLSYHPKVKIETDLDAKLLNLSGSSVHLEKSFMNLASNALEAMPNGGELRIKTGNRYLDRPVSGYDEVREGDYVVLAVSDTGEGISPFDMKRIFEPFYTKKVMGRSGTGLGLAVVWGTVKDHQGYINVESEEGKGSVFTLYFPVTREEITPEQIAVSAAEYLGNGESILIVDDVKEQRELAANMLTKLNYSVAVLPGGEEAVEYLKRHAVDLVVLDMVMDPGMDGLDTYLKMIEIHPRQKAVIVSGFSETERVSKALVLGVGTYVRKPYLLETLGLAVRKTLDGTL